MRDGAVNLLTSWRLSRIGMAWVVALLALTHLAGFAHFALVEHAQCPEHGDWMHVHAGAAHADGSAHANWHGQDAADGHDHCSAPSAFRDRVTTRQPPVHVHELTTVVLRVPARFAPPRVRGPAVTWRTAPKTSPPA